MIPFWKMILYLDLDECVFQDIKGFEWTMVNDFLICRYRSMFMLVASVVHKSFLYCVFLSTWFDFQ